MKLPNIYCHHLSFQSVQVYQLQKNELKMSHIPLIIITVFAVLSHGLYYEDCGSKSAEIFSLGVSGCKRFDQSCYIYENSMIWLIMEFSPITTIKNFTNEVRLIHAVHNSETGKADFKKSAPIDLINEYDCDDLDCPLEANKFYKARVKFDCVEMHRRFTVAITWVMKNEKREDFLCGLANFEIVYADSAIRIR